MAGVAVAGLGSSAAVAAADQGDPARPVLSATIYRTDGTVSTPAPVTTGALTGCKSYGSGPTPELHDRTGDLGTQGLGSKGAWSVSEVLACGLSPGVAAAAVTGVTVHDLHGSPQVNPGSRLGTADLVAPNFADGARPLITYDGSVISYYRPWRGGADLNAADKVEEPGSAPIAVDVFEGPQVNVTVTASDTTVAAGTTVSFTADLHGSGAGAPHYDWDFDGGATDPTSTLASPQEVFASAGTYNVTLQVHDGQGGGGVAQILINVTGPAATTPPPLNAPATGPAQSNGATPGGTAGRQPPKPSAAGSKPPVARPVRPAGEPSARAPKVVPTKAVTPSTAQQGPPVVPAAKAPTANSAVQPRAPIRGPRRRAGGSAGHSRVVDGLLISAITPRPIDASPLVGTVAPVRDTAPAVRRPTRASLATGLAATFAIVLLLSLGAGHELRWRRHLHPVLAGS